LRRGTASRLAGYYCIEAMDAIAAAAEQ
jgi:hypothetical protein